MEKPFIIVRTRRLLRRVPLDDILYIQRKERKLQVETTDTSYLFSGDLREVIPLLDDRFCPVLKRFMINLSRVVSVSKGLALFDCGKEYQFARESGNRLRREFLLYLMRTDRGEESIFPQKTVAESGAGS